MDEKKKFFRIRKILIIIFTAKLILGGCYPNKNLSIDPSTFRVLPIKAYYAEVEEIAKEWRADAYLDDISSTFTMPHEDEDLLIHYGFRSPSDPGSWLLVFCTASDPVQIKVSEGKFQEGKNRPLTKEIDVNQLPFDNLDAITIAYENGGKDFIQKHNSIDPDSLVQLRQENPALGTGKLVWVVIFSTNRFSGLSITLDSSTGEVIETWQNDE